jgi:hypothetical protein
MVGHEDWADEYRQRAEELRATIPDLKDQQTREMIEKVAAGWDQLARVQDNLANADKTIRKS